MILIDAVYINNSGGKVLLDCLVDEIEQHGINVFYLFDDRCRSSFCTIPDSRKLFAKNGMLARYKFYLQHKKMLDKVLCFANVPPLLKLENVIVATYFHNCALLADRFYDYFVGKRLHLLAKIVVISLLKNNSDYWFVQSDNVKQLLAKKININHKKINILPFYKLDNLSTGYVYRQTNTFIYPAANIAYKNHLGLLKAWDILHKKGYNPPLHITLSTMDPVLEEQYLTLINKGANVVNHGFLPAAELKKLYLASEYLIYPSLSESLGLPLIEAIHFGCKVVAADLAYVHAAITPSALFDPTNPESIAFAVERCLHEKMIKSDCLIENKIQELIDFIQ